MKLSDEITNIINYLMETVKDSFPQYIIKKELLHEPIREDEYRRIKESKWYRQLLEEQWENGSWGRFHTQDTKTPVKQKFITTECALARAYELGLTAEDEMVHKSILLMERYINGEEKWLDTNEKHDSFPMFFRTLIAANLSLFCPTHPLVLSKKETCVNILEKVFVEDKLVAKIWEQENQKTKEFILKPYTVYMVWLLQQNDFLDRALEKKYLDYIWNREDGIYYRTNGPSTKVQFLESKTFNRWLLGLESLSGFSLFPEYMNKGITNHLVNEIHRLIQEDVVLPKTSQITGHYAESWRERKARKNDMILRIVRVLVKCEEIT